MTVGPINQNCAGVLMNVANTAKGIFLDKTLIQNKNEELEDKKNQWKEFPGKARKQG